MEEVSTVNNIASENIDFSMFALFMSADFVVKSVILCAISETIFTFFTAKELSHIGQITVSPSSLDVLKTL